jgi:cellulose synthase/poly-beta-1,6-N-acetylglucosamine synthase-like glycosyltransferase
MMTVVMIVFLVYCGVLLWLRYQWKQLVKAPVVVASEMKFISVVVPVRNEEGVIDNLIQSLAAQHYPVEKFEVIIVDDHSTDKTMSVLKERLPAQLVSIRLISSAFPGKKQAITAGVQEAKGEIIITTDADCTMGAEWLSSFNSFFTGDHIKMVCGAVRIEEGDYFAAMQQLEMASLIGCSAIAIKLQHPIMCNGANLAYRKEVFSEVKGYEGNVQIASGDDEHLLHKITGKYPGSVVFNSLRSSIVTTRAQATLDSFIQQRLRWAGKWKSGENMTSRLVAAGVWIFHAMMVTMILMVVFGRLSIEEVLLWLVLKAFAEYYFLRELAGWLRIPWYQPSFILLQMVYSFYVVVMGVWPLFKQPVWKDRVIAST